MIPMTEIPEMQATGEMGVGGVQGMSFPAPDPETVGTKPKKTQKKSQPKDRMLLAPAERLLTEEGSPQISGTFGKNP